MIFMKIHRRCGHEEQIGIAGFSGQVEDVPEKFQEPVVNNIKEAESKLCLPCLQGLGVEGRRKEMDRFK